jgi:uncharacterized protein
MAISLNVRETLFVLLICVISQAILVPAQVFAHGEMGRGPLPSDLRGTYRLETGELLTFTGQFGMPSYELDDRRVFLRPEGDDRFVAWDRADESLTLMRDGGGHVVGLTVVRTGETIARAARVELYSEQDVTFTNGDATLAGSVLVPHGAGPHPAVVIVHGAEAATRESYRLLASHFARRGVAALIYDKRGIGESGGSFRGATFDDLAADALAGVDLLRQLPQVDPARVGMLGISQGAWVIAMAGAASENVAFLIPISASGFSPAVQDRWLNGNIIAHRQLSGAVNRASERAWRMLLSTRDLVDAGLMAPIPDVPGFWFHALDPALDSAALWASVRQPVLAIWGELDCQLPAFESMSAIKRALDDSGHTHYKLIVTPGADHSINLVGPCAQEATGWSVLRVDFPDSYFPTLAEWVLEHDSFEPARTVIQPEVLTPSNLGWHQTPTAGVTLLGSFVPQVALMLALLAAFGGLVIWSLVGTAVTAWRERRVRWTMFGPLAGIGFVAMILAVASLAELLLLGSPDGSLLIEGPLVLGVTPLFALAGVVVTITLLVGAVAFIRAPTRRSARAIISLTVVIALAAWSSYWAMTPLALAIM